MSPREVVVPGHAGQETLPGRVSRQRPTGQGHKPGHQGQWRQSRQKQGQFGGRGESDGDPFETEQAWESRGGSGHLRTQALGSLMTLRRENRTGLGGLDGDAKGTGGRQRLHDSLGTG